LFQIGEIKGSIFWVKSVTECCVIAANSVDLCLTGDIKLKFGESPQGRHRRKAHVKAGEKRRLRKQSVEIRMV